MLIAGLQKITLVDFPGKVAATVFLQGCNFRCGFCHNPEIVIPQRFEGTIPEGEFFRFLETRLGKIQGVCITGGEPLLWRDTGKFISHIKALGFAVKLDTNGSYPDRLEQIIHDGDIDYIAMDIKSPFHNYEKVTNSKIKGKPTVGQPEGSPLGRANTAGQHKNRRILEQKNNLAIQQFNNNITEGDSELIKNIKKSVSLVMNSGLDYEFRTTVAKPLHAVEDFLHIGEMIKGAKKYFIQNFVQSKHINDEISFSPFSPAELKLAEANIAPFVEMVGVR